MLRTAVIGTGYLGRFHAQKYVQLPDNELIGVVDIDKERGGKVADECRTRFFVDYRELFGKVDAVSIAVPTCHHYQVALDCLQAGVHILIEKPICDNTEHSRRLVNLAREKSLIMQVGFLERFNPVLSDIRPMVQAPRFIESHRLAGFKPRSMDINVIMDIMIHDLDIVLDLVDSPISQIAANGASVLSRSVDIAQARLSFASGCVANITASRISENSKRKMRIFQQDACLSIDFQNFSVKQYFKGKGEQYPGVPSIEHKAFSYVDSDSLKREIADFIHCVRFRKTPRVCGESGHRALEVATRISDIIAGAEQ
ncbi:UDP-N-acetyl-D-glucosamine dehydrogenase [Endozoicomonas montiporae]|uniref:UDP-N-acetyl-D-glucosamine dehydrogenase n=2 Tax=Endozoicomonas montiporae TaxID=1027273 RepID=A0A081N1V3_9GAMM|nr:Gfo/Idh/MocA family oxidoreductase [Endozoicomonas montiporae]AMO58632.1 Gfo/Idh/MocA family oxidoreductase [Endozoicomonas montiporae CL-33]KEQ12426.1 UDP-N-acetyl-D-glucosamine dehydrogenase [Endozoicomonas montiporae]